MKRRRRKKNWSGRGRLSFDRTQCRWTTALVALLKEPASWLHAWFDGKKLVYSIWISQIKTGKFFISISIRRVLIIKFKRILVGCSFFFFSSETSTPTNDYHKRKQRDDIKSNVLLLWDLILISLKLLCVADRISSLKKWVLMASG